MTSERSFSIVNLILKFVAIILITVGIYFFVTNFLNFIKVNNKSYDETNLDILFQDLKSLFATNKKYFYLAISGIILAYLTYIFDIVILSIASWSSQASGKIQLLVSTILPIPLWVVSWIGNILIIAKKRDKTIQV
ncbi:hypothetical protein OF364_01490 [Mycoplasma enhydrae]|uniref:hypothetical protein n=1 Tax=Mycoplasma enhydrae TaxID=2499220 RepID=UPI00197B5952|nr:hypothetical protein [Mycoplasma enhydrae]MBN4089302.1 hypothetical protein [Mycoplasma enhydrae]MCV3733538.1 hypothetical protein [Mycoplasma enhydrae]MCV3753486.1 hypothetical protein [Mycoplasma enhydrae]